MEAGSAGLAVGLDISSHYMPGVIDLLALRVVPWKTGFFLFGVILVLSGDGVGMGTFASEESESRCSWTVRHNEGRTASLKGGEGSISGIAVGASGRFIQDRESTIEYVKMPTGSAQRKWEAQVGGRSRTYRKGLLGVEERYNRAGQEVKDRISGRS